MNIQNRDNFFTAGAPAIKKIKIFRSCSDLVTTMCDDLYDNVQMLSNSVIVKCKVMLATLQSTIIKWQHSLSLFLCFAGKSNRLKKNYGTELCLNHLLRRMKKSKGRLIRRRKEYCRK